MDARTLLIVDDHPLVRDALAQAARAVGPVETRTASSLADARAAIDAAPPDAVALDLRMDDVDGLEGLITLRGLYPDLPVLVVSAYDDPMLVKRAKACGAAGYVSKAMGLSEMTAAIAGALSGAAWSGLAPPAEGEEAPVEGADAMAQRLATLTPAQHRVLVGLMEGRLNKQIAYDMDISEATVKAHVTAVFRKLGVRNRTQAVLAAKEAGLAS